MRNRLFVIVALLGVSLPPLGADAKPEKKPRSARRSGAGATVMPEVRDLNMRIGIDAAMSRERAAAAQAAIEQIMKGAQQEAARVQAELAKAGAATGPYAQLGNALAAFNAGRHAEAAGLADQVAAAAQGDLALDARFLAGISRYRAGDFKGAVTALSDPAVEKRQPESVRFRGLARYKAGDKRAALDDLRRSQLRDDDAEGLAAFATLLIEAGATGEAGEALTRAARANPSDRNLLLASARAALATKRTADAIDPLERAVALDPKDRPTVYLLAFAYTQLGRAPDAERTLRTYVGATSARGGAGRDAALAVAHHDLFVVPLYPVRDGLDAGADDARARLQLAAFLINRGQLEPAAAELAAIDKPSGAALYARGVVSLRLGNLEDAARVFADAERAEPSRPDAAHGLGVVALRRGDLAAAGEAFARAARLGKEAAPRIGLAVVAAQSGKPDDGARQLGGLTGDRQFGDAARFDLAVSQHLAKKADAAARELGKVGRGMAQQPEAFVLAGRLALDRKDTKGAVASFSGATALAPEYVDAWLELAEAAGAAGDRDRAADAYRRALDRVPNDIDAREALAKLYDASGNTAGAARERDRIAQIRKAAKKELADQARDGAIGIGAFENTARDAQYDWLQQGIPEALTTDLKKTGLKILERNQIARAVQEQKLGELGLVDPSTAPKVGKLVGAQAMIVGSFQIQGDQIRMNARLVDVSDGHVIQTGDASGPISTLFALERRLAMDLVGDYYGVDAATKKKIFQAPATTIKALEQIAGARLLLFQGQESAAKEKFRRAMEEDPNFARDVAKFQKEFASVSATVACLPLQNISGNKEQDWYSRGIAESLGGDLKRLGILMVERLAIDKVLTEKRFSDLFNPDQAQAAGKQLGAAMVVVGGYQVLAGQLQIDVRIVQVETSQVLLAEKVIGSEGQLFALQAQLAEKIAKILDRPVTREELARLSQGKPSIEDFKKYIRQQSQVAIGGDTPKETVTINSVAVGAFDNLSGRTEDESFADGLSESVHRQLSRAPRLRLVDRGKVVEAARSGADPKALGLAVNADALVLGTYQTVGDRIRIEGRAVSTRSGEVLVSAKAEGAVAEVGRVEEQLGNTLMAGLGITAKDLEEGENIGSHRPVYKKWWFWGGIGAAVVGGTVAAIALSSGNADAPEGDVTVDCRGGTCE